MNAAGGSSVKELAGSRLLVTGCAGFIGSHLTERLLDRGATVVGVDCFNDNYGRTAKLGNLARAREWDSFDFVPLDLSRGELDDLVDDVDGIFHLAAEPGVRTSWGNRFGHYLRNNVAATQHLLEAAKSVPSTRFVYASSSSIYGDAARYPTDESATPQPRSPYGVSKLAAEQLCSLYHANFGVSTVSLRLFSVYGPRQRPDMAFSLFIRELNLGASAVTVFGDGRQARDFTFVTDVVDAMLLAATSESASGAVLNIGGGGSVSILDALDALRDISGHDITPEFGPVEHGDVRDTCADVAAARDVLGFRARTPFAEGLRAQYEWAANPVGSGA